MERGRSVSPASDHDDRGRGSERSPKRARYSDERNMSAYRRNRDVSYDR